MTSTTECFSPTLAKMSTTETQTVSETTEKIGSLHLSSQTSEEVNMNCRKYGGPLDAHQLAFSLSTERTVVPEVSPSLRRLGKVPSYSNPRYVSTRMMRVQVKRNLLHAYARPQNSPIQVCAQTQRNPTSSAPPPPSVS